jgi:AhpD family alkylhydroperoxidase
MEYWKVAPAGLKAMSSLEEYLRASGLEKTLLHIVKLRASQINGCAYCIDMHWREAREAGEPEHRLYGLGAWREGPWYSERERAALAWTESLTLVAASRAPDADYAAVRSHFDDKTLVDLTWAIAAINAWNRMSIAFRSQPSTPRPK